MRKQRITEDSTDLTGFRLPSGTYARAQLKQLGLGRARLSARFHRCSNDRSERIDLKTSPTDKGTIDIRLCKELESV